MAHNFFDIKSQKATASSSKLGVGSSSSLYPSCVNNASKIQPWVEKYRPKTLEDVTAQEHTVKVLRHTLTSSNLPHLLFYGPPGTGKTSTVLALAKQLFGPELFRTRVLELNASDERGINIVREKIKNFARQQLSNVPLGQAGVAYKEKYPCPPFKIIILDEADCMTNDAQSALRRTMETFSRITRFCLVCNYVTRIIDPLASRCSKFRFKSLDTSLAEQRIRDIAAAENLTLEPSVVGAIVRCSEGDLRRGITYLQSLARLVDAQRRVESNSGTVKTTNQTTDYDGDISMQDSTSENQSLHITDKLVEEIAEIVPADVIDDIISVMQPRPGVDKYCIDNITEKINDVMAEGWSASALIMQLFNRVMYDERITDKQKCRAAQVFGETDSRLVDGADEHIAILDLCVQISMCICNSYE